MMIIMIIIIMIIIIIIITIIDNDNNGKIIQHPSFLHIEYSTEGLTTKNKTH